MATAELQRLPNESGPGCFVPPLVPRRIYFARSSFGVNFQVGDNRGPSHFWTVRRDQSV